MNKLVFIFIFIMDLCLAQLPETDIWLFSIKHDKAGFAPEKGENITNRIGYDNQPSFSQNGKELYYVSVREDKQADVFVYDIKSKKHKQLTKTPESEYSPIAMPNNNGISCVVVEKDSTQRVWMYDNKSGIVKNLLFYEDSIGYYNILNIDTILYYKLTSPHSLRLHSLKSGKDIFIANEPVRGFKTINRHEFIYGIKDSSSVTFYKYNTILHKATRFCKHHSLNEDIYWSSNLGLMISNGSKILLFDEKDGAWKDILDLSSFGIIKITRFVFNEKMNQLVVVDNK